MSIGGLWRRPFDPDATEELLSFCRQHPTGGLDGATRERLLTRLVSGPDCIIDLFEGQERVMVAVAIDTLSEPDDTVVTEVLGCGQVLGWEGAGGEVIDAGEAAAARAHRPRIAGSWPHPIAAGLAATLARRGYRLAWVDYKLERPPGPAPAIGPMPGQLS